MRKSRADIIRYLCQRMESLYPLQERQIIARMAAAHFEGCSEMRYLTDPNEVVELQNLELVADELANGRPIQYVIGYSEFCGYRFSVSEGVLIPRPETEELVMWLTERASDFESPHILDICTGSGCIAISLKLALARSKVTAIDLSAKALAIAHVNADNLNADIEFLCDDALGDLPTLSGRKFDFIASNPPYIPRSEQAIMHRNVTEYEPEMALFVEDNDPLIFYRSIARSAHNLLNDNGMIFFELHHLWAEAAAAMLREEGYCNIEIKVDGFGKQRMICCQKGKR